MKILQVPDLHCFPPTYDRVDGEGAHSRLTEWYEAARAVAAIAERTQPALIVAPGDYFINARPSAAQVIAVSWLFGRLAETAPVIGCAGNHDLAGSGQPGPVAIIAEIGQGYPYGEAWGLETPQVVHRDDLGFDVAVLPAVKPAGLLEQAADPAALAQLVSEKLVDIARGLRAECDAQTSILVGHWTIAGSVTSSGQIMVGGIEPAIPLAELEAQNWNAVLMGHIHKPQVLSKRPFIAYAGSLLRGDFGEEHDERGCYLIDLAAGTHEFISVPARRFLTIDLDTTDLEWIAGGGSPDAPLADEPVGDAIVRVRYRATAEVAKRIDHGAIVRALERAGARMVAGIYPEVERTDRARAEISETTGPLEALEEWLDLRPDVSPELRERVTAAAGQVIREVA